MYAHTQESNHMSNVRMADIESVETYRRTTVKGKIYDRMTDVSTYAREIKERKIHFYLSFHPLHNLQE